MTLVMVPVDSFEYELLEAYCLGKSGLWNFFYGWQMVKILKSGNRAYYKLRRKDYMLIKRMADNMIIKYNF